MAKKSAAPKAAAPKKMKATPKSGRVKVAEEVRANLQAHQVDPAKIVQIIQMIEEGLPPILALIKILHGGMPVPPIVSGAAPANA